jgi:Icc-related predicted phosphoesterase
MKILTLSDKILPFIYSPKVKERFDNVDFIIGSGDLPYYYLEYAMNALDKPLFFVHGNHDPKVENYSNIEREAPRGGVNLHRKVMKFGNILIAGVEGSIRYRPGDYQYNQFEMWLNVISLVPRLYINRLKYGRSLDIFVTHAPPKGVHDDTDLPHRGIIAFRWLIDNFYPRYFVHGHVHVYRPNTDTRSVVGKTIVINTYGYQEIELE